MANPLRPRPTLWRWLVNLSSIDRAVGYTLLTRFVSLAAGPLSIFFQLRYLTGEEQAYTFAFIGVLGIVGLGEFGIGPAIAIFAAHEMAILHWNADDSLTGSPAARARLRSLMRLGLAWNAAIAVAVVAFVVPFGFWFFGRFGSTAIAWQVPWVVCALASACEMLTGTPVGVLGGSGMIAEVSAMRLRAVLAGNVASWATLAAGGKLLAAPVLAVTTLSVTAVHLWAWRRRLWTAAAGHPDGGTVAYWTEIWPLQWRMGLSWLGGYLSNYIISPILLAVSGPRIASQYGMSMQIGAALQNLSYSWINAHGPTLAGQVARREWAAMDAAFFKRLWIGLAVTGFGGALAWGGVWGLYAWDSSYADRFVPPLAFAALMAAAVAGGAVWIFIAYLRLHKTDPLFLATLLYGALFSLMVLAVGKPFGVAGIAATSLVAYLMLLGYALWLFREARRGHRLVGPPDN